MPFPLAAAVPLSLRRLRLGGLRRRPLPPLDVLPARRPLLTHLRLRALLFALYARACLLRRRLLPHLLLLRATLLPVGGGLLRALRRGLTLGFSLRLLLLTHPDAFALRALPLRPLVRGLRRGGLRRRRLSLMLRGRALLLLTLLTLGLL